MSLFTGENAVKKVIFMASIGSLVCGLLCSIASASGPSISDKDLNVSLNLPDDFESVSEFNSPPNADIRYAFKRIGSEGISSVCVFILRLPGTIGREQMMGNEWLKLGASRVYLEKWKSFDVEVVVIKERVGDTTFITRNVQIPIKPYAIQLKIFGHESRDEELAVLTRTLLASLDGPTNWLTDQERSMKLSEGIGRLSFWVVLIGVGVYGLSSWRTKRFRRKAIAMGLPVELSQQKIRPSWAWYLLPTYLLFASLIAASTMTFIYRGHRIWSALSLFFLGIIVAAIITGFVKHRRNRDKRRILASLPKPPLPKI